MLTRHAEATAGLALIKHYSNAPGDPHVITWY